MQAFLLVQRFLVMIIDGIDTASIGFIAPVIKADWVLKASQLAPLFGSGLFGLTLGALAAGPFADRSGRKAGVLWSIGLFGVASLVSALGGVVSAELIASLGWRSVLGSAACFPLHFYRSLFRPAGVWPLPCRVWRKEVRLRRLLASIELALPLTIPRCSPLRSSVRVPAAPVPR